MQFDVCVLGGGVAGAAAALAATERGARTCVVAGPPGATALFAGAWRGSCPDGLQRALAAVGYELRPCDSPLPHSHGDLVVCSAAPPTHLAARLAGNSIIVGIAGLPGFAADILAKQWAARASTDLSAHTLTVDGTPAAGWAPVSLAAHIERSPEILIDPLRSLVQTHAASGIVLPAVLGVHFDDALRTMIANAIHAEVGEALAVPPSLPGWRLHQALRRALGAAGVSVLEGKGIATLKRDARIREIELFNGDVIAAHAFVLATGKYAAGGIEVDGAFREPAFGCPVWVEHLDERFETVDSLILTDPVRTEDQPILRAGVHTNAEHRPVNAMQDVVYTNVAVAGSVRAGWTSATHGVGDAASDGWSAGLSSVSS